MPRHLLWLAGPFLLLAALGCGRTQAEANGTEPSAQAEENRGVRVLLEAAEKRSIAETIEGWGRCEALPERIATITPAVEGRVKTILVKLGAGVKQGQSVVQLDPRIAEANLADKKATCDGLKASLKLLQAPLRPEELKNQELAIEQTKVALLKAQATVERLRPLVGGQISGAQLLEAENGVKLAELQQQSAEAQLAVLRLGPRREAVKEAEAKITTAEANVATAEEQLHLCTLESPIEGTIDSLSCRLGQALPVGSPAGEVIDTRVLYVVIWLSDRDAARIQIGHRADIRVNDPTSETKPAESAALNGSVVFVGHSADPQTGNVPVRILLENPQGRLHLGQMVSVSITVRKKEEALVVPVAALFDVGQGPVFSIVREGKSVRAHPELGLRNRHWVEVIDSGLSEPLQAGEQVILEGGYNLPEGNPVLPISSAEGVSR